MKLHRIKAIAGDRFRPDAKLDIKLDGAGDVPEEHRELLAQFSAPYLDMEVNVDIQLHGDFMSAEQDEVITDISIRAIKYRAHMRQHL